MTLPSRVAPFDRRAFLAAAVAAPLLQTPPPARPAPAAPSAQRAPANGLALADALAGARELVTEHLQGPAPNDEAWVHGAAALFAQVAELPPDPFGAMSEREAAFLRAHTWTFRRVDAVPADRARPAVITHQIHVAPGGRIPLHDHRELFGAIVLVDGELEIRSFDVVEGSAATATVTLQESNRAWLAPGRFALLTRARDNVHEFRAGAKGARLLDLFVWLGADSRSHDLTFVDDPDRAAADRRYRARWS